MGVNGQKRKKKQGPVPTLEETFPKKFKSDKPAKLKTQENEGPRKPNKRPVSTKVDSNGVDEDEAPDLGVTKASLFDDIDEDEDEFEGLENMCLLRPA